MHSEAIIKVMRSKHNSGKVAILWILVLVILSNWVGWGASFATAAQVRWTPDQGSPFHPPIAWEAAGYRNPLIASVEPSLVLNQAHDLGSTSFAEASERLGKIAEKMQRVRLCNRSAGCRYRDITFDAIPSEAQDDPEVLYTGSISALIERPAGIFDQARYRFQFKGDRWELLGGEEVADVSSFFFEGDHYEVFSSYSSRIRMGKLKDASRNLRVGYRDLYYEVMDSGQERY